MLRFLQLGASLYVPATRPDAAAIGSGEKHPRLRSVIFCTEDAIFERDVPAALHNLEKALRRFEPAPLLRFVRVRSPEILRQLLHMDGVGMLTGFVLPKIKRPNLEEYLSLLDADDRFQLMPVLETAELFDPVELLQLRNWILAARCRRRVLSLRIGGNDLLQHLGLRRPPARSIYATPLNALIQQLVALFRPQGLNLTGPVFERLDQPKLLARETRKDLALGLFGKSAIHPDQVPVIEAQYRVGADDLLAADMILANESPPVFRLHGAMCEPATHRAWAEIIRERARLYGVVPKRTLPGARTKARALRPLRAALLNGSADKNGIANMQDF